ncbi:hypothetical protein V1525DRAFT_8457 [Lipomyces kononenkoae]|uniref:Uncharacterized protein n=1 Tax=Lipomyces kononenkoae TaxID=34357 RepID=A0ACC3TBQ6_LIPKO
MNVPTRYRSLRRKKAEIPQSVPPVSDSNPSGRASETVAHGSNRDHISTLPIQLLDENTVVSCGSSPVMTASALISTIQRQSGKLPYRIEMLRVAEIYNNSLQRELLGFELVNDVVKGWDPLKDNNRLRIVLSNSWSMAMTVEAVLPEHAPPVAGWLRINRKLNKWSKRWAFTEQDALYITKKPNSRVKDRILLCNLSQVNFYHVHPAMVSRIASPTDLCFAIKSPENHAIFENHSDFMHYAACDDRASFDMWRHAVETTRAIYVQKIARLRLDSFAQSDILDRQALPAPLIAPEELAKPIDQRRFTIEKDSKILNSTLMRSLSGRRPRPSLPVQQQNGPTIVAPTPEHLTVTKDSLLDRLLHGEIVATTSSTQYDNYDPMPPRRRSDENVRLESHSLAKSTMNRSKTVSVSRRKEASIPPPIDTSGRHDPQHIVLASPASFSTSESSNYFSSPDIESSTPRVDYRRTIRDRERRNSPLRTSLLDSTPDEVRVEEPDDDNTPLYKKLQQLDLTVGSKNPFLDSQIMATASVEHKDSIASLHNLVAPKSDLASSNAKFESPKKVHDGYSAAGKGSVETVNQGPNKKTSSSRLAIQHDDQRRRQGHSLHVMSSRHQNSDERLYSADRRVGEWAANVPSRSKTVRESSGAHAHVRRNVSVRGTSSRSPLRVVEPLINVVSEDRTLFHEGSLLARMENGRRY